MKVRIKPVVLEYKFNLSNGKLYSIKTVDGIVILLKLKLITLS